MLTLKDVNTNKTWKFENKTDASDFISTISFGFEWQLIDNNTNEVIACHYYDCLLYTSPSPRDTERSRMPSSA